MLGSGGAWVGNSLTTRVSALEDKYVRTTRFATISSGTSGNVTLPPNSQVVPNDFGGTVDAVISTISGGRPDFQAAYTGATPVATSFDSSGNYVLTSTPDTYSVAILYRVQQKLVDFDSTSSDIVGDPDYTGGAGGGSVTSVAMSVPSFLSVAGSPITGSGTLAVTLATQTANTIFAGPVSGGAAVPTFRAMVADDIPDTGVIPGIYTNSDITVDSKGRILSISNGGGGSGTVTSVDITADPIFVVTGGPITTSGTIDLSFDTQVNNQVFASPDALSGVPSFRLLVNDDLPTVVASKGGTGLTSYTTGDILYASAATTLAGLAAVATGSVLVSAGTGTAPVYSNTPQVTRIGIGTAAGASTEITVLQPVRTSGSPTMISWTGGAHTTLAASTEVTDVNYILNRTVQLSAGALTLQRAFRVQAPTYAFTSASTISDAYTMVIDQVVAGTNATITRPHALWVNGRLKVGAGTTGFLVRDNTSSGLFCAMYNANSTPANSNHVLMHNGITTILNGTSSGNLQLAIDAVAVAIISPNNMSVSGTIAGTVFSATNSSTSAAVNGASIICITNGYNSGNGILNLNSTTATSNTIQTFIVCQKNGINASTTQEHNIEYALRDNSSSRAAATISMRYSDTGSGTQKTRFTFRTLTGGTTKNDSQIFDGLNAFFGGSTTPTAHVHLAAGSATANTAPLQFTSGTNETTARAGVMEYDGTNLFFTRTGSTRETVFVGVDGAAAPSTSVGVAITNFYGSAATNFLGDPNSWASVVIAGTTYKIPLYT